MSDITLNEPSDDCDNKGRRSQLMVALLRWRQQVQVSSGPLPVLTEPSGASVISTLPAPNLQNKRRSSPPTVVREAFNPQLQLNLPGVEGELHTSCASGQVGVGCAGSSSSVSPGWRRRWMLDALHC